MLEGRVLLTTPRASCWSRAAMRRSPARGAHREPRSSPGRAMRSPGRSTTRRCWRPLASRRRAERRCRRPAARDRAGRGQRLRRRDRGARRGAGGRARCPLLHLPRGRAAERRPGRGGRGGARRGAGARSATPARRSPSARCCGSCRTGARRRSPMPAARSSSARIRRGAHRAVLRAAGTFELEAARATCCARRSSARPTTRWPGRASPSSSRSFGDLRAAEDAADRARRARAPDLARTQMVLGFAALTRIDIDQAKAAFERAIALDSAEPLARLGLGLARIRAGDLDAGGRELEIAVGARPEQLAAAQLPRQGLLRGAPRAARRRAVPDRQGARPERPDPLVLRRDPPADREPPGRGAAQPRDARSRSTTTARSTAHGCCSTRTVRPAASASPGSTTISAFEQLGINEAAQSLALDPANSAGAPVPLGPLCRRAAARGRASQRAAAGAAAAAGRPQPDPAEPRLRDLDIVARSGPARAAFNEFTPLFTRNGVQVAATGLARHRQHLWRRGRCHRPPRTDLDQRRAISLSDGGLPREQRSPAQHLYAVRPEPT